MKLNKLLHLALVVVATFCSVALSGCGGIPEREAQVGPQSANSTIPWNRRLPGEGSAALGGLVQ